MDLCIVIIYVLYIYVGFNIKGSVLWYYFYFVIINF